MDPRFQRSLVNRFHSVTSATMSRFMAGTQRRFFPVFPMQQKARKRDSESESSVQRTGLEIMLRKTLSLLSRQRMTRNMQLQILSLPLSGNSQSLLRNILMIWERKSSPTIFIRLPRTMVWKAQISSASSILY